MASTIQIRVDDELKQKSDLLFKELGTDTTTAVRMFLTQAVAVGGFPFEIRKITHNPFLPLSEEEIYDKLERSRTHCKSGSNKDAGKTISDLRSKYDL